MSYGTHKAIAGTMRATTYAADGATEAVRRFDACKTVADVRAVLAWAKDRGGFFLRTGEADKVMRAAFERARARTEGRTS